MKEKEAEVKIWRDGDEKSETQSLGVNSDKQGFEG
jgi:hypothetical protein